MDISNEVYDDETRTVISSTGFTRPYDDVQNAEADKRALAAQQAANRAVIEERAAAALDANAAFLADDTPTNAETLAQVRMLTRECNALIRLALSRLDDISDTSGG